jgi:hypothetical protein
MPKLSRLVVLLLAMRLMLALSSTAASADVLWWRPAVVIDPLAASAVTYQSSITCPSVSLCVATDAAGDVVTSTHPAGGASTWTAVHLSDVAPMACPSVSLCVGFDGGTGNVIASNDPAAGAAAWSVSHVDSGPLGLVGVECPSVRLCVAFDGDGNVITSTDPAGGASAWTVAHVDTTDPACGSHGSTMCPGAITALACPSASLCVGVDSNGYVLTSTDPAGGPSAWTIAPVDTAAQYENYSPLVLVSCPSISLCVAADFTGNIVTSTDPTGGASAWKLTAVQSNVYGFINDLACPSVSLCVGSGSGTAVTSRNPTGGTGAWKSFTVEAEGSTVGTGLACPSVSLCVAGGGAGDLWQSSNPAAGSAAWEILHLDGGDFISDVACPSSALCVALDAVGHAVIGSAQPTVAQAKAVLQKQLKPHGKSAAIGAVLAHDGYTFTFDAPAAGHLNISWYAGSTRAQVATSNRPFARARDAAIEIKLTPNGRRLLSTARRLTVTAAATFIPARAARVSASTRFTLHR